jgi:adenylate kinase
MNVILLGPPGSGKGTQGEILVRRLRVRRIASADLLSAAIQEDTEMGRKSRSYMDQGSMVPDGIILRLLKEQLQAPEAAEGVVLDGFPRTIRQAEEVNRMLVAQGKGGRTVLLLNVPEEELVRRLLAKASAEGRSDETSETIGQRLAAYRKSNAPLVGHYRELGVLKIIPGTGTIEEVAEKIKKAIGR